MAPLNRLFLFAVALFVVAPQSCAQSTGWLNSSWLYRSLVTVANPGGTALTNYQVHVALGASFDFTKTQPNGADIRFTASDGVTALPFWIESWNPATSSASLWVKVPSLPAAGATLYMYYGNSAAVTASSGNSTFDFFDDFGLGSIDTTKWTASGGTWSVVTGTEPNGLSGTIALGSTNRPPDQILYSSSFTGGDYIFEAYGLQQSGRHWGIGTRVNGPSNFYSAHLYADLNASNNLYAYEWLNNNNSAIQLGSTAVGTINLNTWYKLRMAVHGTSIDVYLNDVQKIHATNAQFSTGGVALFGGENMVANFAYVRARQFAATEPTVTVGSGSTLGGAVISSLTLNPASVVGGSSAQGTVTLSGPAPSGGAIVTLTSSNTAVAQVPASVTIAANATTATFTITTTGVSSSTNSTITASYNSTSKIAILTVLPPITISSLALNPTSVIGGTTSQGTVTLSAAAPSGGISVSLSSDNTAYAQVPANVTVAANSTTATFTITTSNVTTATTANITASYNNSSQIAPLSIVSATYRSAITVANPGGTALTNYQVHVALGASFDFTKTQPNGADIRFAASDGVTALPFWIESWNPATSSASLWVKVPSLPAAGATLYMYYGNSAAVTASSGNSTFDFFDDFSLGSIDATKWTASGGTWSVVTGTEPNGLSGTIALGSTNRPPNQILYSSSFTGGDYIFEAYGLQQSGRHWGVGTRVNGPSNFYSADLYADLDATNNLYAYEWLNNNGTGTAIQLGSTAVGTINLNTWYKLRMAVHGTSIDVYLNDVQKIHATDAQFSTGGVALFGGENMVANFAYVRARQFAATEPTATVGSGSTLGGAVISSLTLNPASVVGGSSAQGTVTLSGPAPSGGAIVTLTSSNTAVAQVPASVTIAANATTAAFAITTTGVSSSTNSTITASYNSTSKIAILTVLPSNTISSLALNPTSVIGGTTSQGTVTLSAAAPSGGISVSLSSDNTAYAQVPANVTVAANSTTATFTITTSNVTTATTANITASYNNSSQIAPLSIVSATYRSAITVANPGGTALTNYQVHVALGASFDFTKTQPNGADIRFAASDGVTALPFWIESWNPATSSASLWVKVPSLPAAGATLYMYYGNSAAVSASSGSSTFDFFDDFSLGSIDATKWTASGGTWSVVTGTEPNGLSGTIALGSTNRPPNQILYSSSFTGGDYIFEAYGLQQSGRHWGIGTRVNGPSNFYSADLYADLDATNNLYAYEWLNNNGTGTAIQLGSTAVGTINLNTWYKLRMAVHGTSIDVYLNDVQKIHATNAQFSTGGVALFGGENMVANFAYVRARQFATLEPTSSTGTAVGITTPQALTLPGSLTFGSQMQGTTSTAQNVTLTNVGPQPLTISNVSTTGDFSETNNCPASLISGSSCMVNVTFTPSATGTRSGTLSFTDNAPSGTQSVALVGTGGAVAGVTVTLSPRSTAVNFTMTQQFTATVTGTTNTAVNWYVDGIAGGTPTVGTISSSGLYTPPAAVGPHSVTATSVGNPSASASATIYISNYSGSFTYHNDNQRTGQNVNETALTPSNVNSTQFGKLFSLPVDGQLFAQPLYVPSLTIGSQVHNVLFLATQHESVYAWDADTASTTPLWRTSFINPAAGVTTVPCAEAASGDCSTIYPEFGITSTPVIDSSTGTLYVVAITKEVSGTTTTYVYRLHALNITTGAEKFGGPVVLQASVSGSSGTVTFVPKQHLQRPGLLLANGVVYIGFGSHGDNSPWYGWLLGYNASTLQQVTALNTAPNGGGGSIWQSGCAPAADVSGNIYFVTGNGAFTANTGGVDYGDTIVKLNSSGTVLDYFTPYNQATLNFGDEDLGSGGLVLLPDQTGTYAHVLIGAGKQGVIYSVNRDGMGKFNTAGNQNIQSLIGLSGGGAFGSPAYWNGNIYYAAWNDFVRAFHVTNGMLALSSHSVITLAFPGATPSVSANGTNNGIVWIIQVNVPNDTVITSPPTAVLRAYDATNLDIELYDSTQAGTRDTAGGAVKFVVPTIANGKVYMGNSNQVTVYGLLP